jgi:hypothetical protein
MKMIDPRAYFKPFAKILDKFADEHNLQVEKYRRNLPQWSFSFQHPLGGNGRVDIQVNAQHEVSMVQWWIVSDYERHTRKLKSMPTERIETPMDCLEEKLLSAIQKILEWQLGELRDAGTFARGPWSDDVTQRPQFPLPKL